jgi:NAD(P)-dependent dehydrogenase (short-subunit alcohol dehydrogenase family)
MYSRLPSVVANAGISERAEDIFQDTFTGEGELKEPEHRVLKTNLESVVNVIKIAVHYFRKQAGGKGKIVLVSSTAGIWGESRLPAYSAAKHGVRWALSHE